MARRIFLPCLLGLALAVLPGTPWAAQDAGTEPALYLGGGARPIALGRAGATESNSPFLADWNPAGLGCLPQSLLALQQAYLFGGAVQETAAFAYPTLEYGAVALEVNRMETGGVDRRDSLNVPQGTFGLIEQQFSLAYGYPLLPELSLGASLKVHTLYLDEIEARAPGADFGFLLVLPHPLRADTEPRDWLEEVRLGGFYQNAFSPVLRLRELGDRLPPEWRLGTSLTLALFPHFPNAFQLRGEVEKPERGDPRFHGGLEYSFFKDFSVRGGWDQEYFSAGAGISAYGIRLDYAVSFPVLGMRHLMSLTVDLGNDVSDLKARRAAEEAKKRQDVLNNLKKSIVTEYKQKAWDLAQKKDFPGAIKLWEKVLDWDPADRETTANLEVARQEVLRQEIHDSLQAAEQAFREERYVDAMVECRTVLDKDPNNGPAAKMYADSEKRASRLGEASVAQQMKSLEKIQKAYKVGLEAYTRKQWQKAIEEWERVIADSPLQKQVYGYLRQAKIRLQTEAEQEKTRQEQGSQTEQKRKQLYKDAISLSTSGKLKEAVQTWDRLSKENPKDEDARQNLEKTRKDLIDSQKKGIRW